MRTNDAVDTICANDDVRGCRGPIFEMYVYGTVFLVHDLIDAFVEVGAFRGDAFDELVEEVGAMHALLACGVFLGVNELAFVFTFALLMGRKSVSIIRARSEDSGLTTTKLATVFACSGHKLPVACLSNAARASGLMSVKACWALGPMPTPAPISPKVGAAS